jgi:sec-independent protein translocase protein TatA
VTVHLGFLGGGVSMSEIALVLAVLLLLFGARRLPYMARSLGRAVEELKRAARDVTRDILSDSPESNSPDFKNPPRAPDERKG